MKKEFVCAGCNETITINNDIPEKRVFVWTSLITHLNSDYCFNCDFCLIQGEELPVQREARLAQQNLRRIGK